MIHAWFSHPPRITIVSDHSMQPVSRPAARSLDVTSTMFPPQVCRVNPRQKINSPRPSTTTPLHLPRARPLSRRAPSLSQCSSFFPIPAALRRHQAAPLPPTLVGHSASMRPPACANARCHGRNLGSSECCARRCGFGRPWDLDRLGLTIQSTEFRMTAVLFVAWKGIRR